MSEKEKRYVPELPTDKINRNGYGLNEKEIKASRISVVLNSVIFFSDWAPYVRDNGETGGNTEENKYVGKTLIEIFALESERIKKLEEEKKRGIISKLGPDVQSDKDTLKLLQTLFDLYPDTQAIIFDDSAKNNPLLEDLEEINEGVGLCRGSYPKKNIRITKIYKIENDGADAKLKVNVEEIEGAPDGKIEIVEKKEEYYKGNLLSSEEIVPKKEFTGERWVFYANRGTIAGEFSATLRDIVLGNCEFDEKLFEGSIFYGAEASGFQEYNGFTGQNQLTFDAFNILSDYSVNKGKNCGLDLLENQKGIKIKDNNVLSDEEADKVFITGFSQGGHKALYTYFKLFLGRKEFDNIRKKMLDENDPDRDNNVFDRNKFMEKYKCIQVNSPGFNKASWEYFMNKINNEQDFKDLCSGITAVCADNDIISPLDKKNFYRSIFFEGGGHTCSKININKVSDYKSSYTFYGAFLNRLLEFVGAKRENNPNEKFSNTSIAAFDRFVNGNTKDIFGNEIKLEFGWTLYSIVVVAWCFVMAWFDTIKVRMARIKLFMKEKMAENEAIKKGEVLETKETQEKFYTKEFMEMKEEVFGALKEFFSSRNKDILKEFIDKHLNLEYQTFTEVKREIFSRIKKLKSYYDRKTKSTLDLKDMEQVTEYLEGFINLFIHDDYKERLMQALNDIEPNIFGIGWQMIKNIFKGRLKFWENSSIDRKCYNIFKVMEKSFDANKVKAELYESNDYYDKGLF